MSPLYYKFAYYNVVFYYSLLHSIKLFSLHVYFSIWLDGVLPMVLDREIGAKDKCLSILEDVLLVGILKGQEDNQFVWRLLVLSTDNDKPDLR